MPSKKQVGKGYTNIHIIVEHHNMSMRTVAAITKILTSASPTDKVAVVAELSMCNNFRMLDSRISVCDEEPVCMNTINCVITLIASLCGYNDEENKEAFRRLYPSILDLGWIPQLGDVTIEQERKVAIDVLISHTMKLLKDCSSPALYRIYRDMLQQALPNCKDLKMALNISNDLRDRWLSQQAIEHSKKHDMVIVIAGFSHLQRLVHLLGPLPQGRVWA